jgi:dihydrofolate reductase
MITVDGFTEGPGGDVMAMPMDAAFSANNVERVRAARGLLLGATTYRGMLQYWPHQVDNPDATPDDRYIASRYAGDLSITVVSDSLTRSDIPVWGERTEIVSRADSHEAVARLRAEPDDRDILVFGSRTLWTDLLASGLVDELCLMIGPKVVAGDRRAFEGLPPTDLRLIDVRSWRDSGSVLLRYAPGNAR